VTRGRRALLAVLQRTTARELARRVHRAPSTVSEWAAGIKTPSPRARAELHACYGILPASWDVVLRR
jgi:transcriptional regulator with XRE-family HTH domain